MKEMNNKNNNIDKSLRANTRNSRVAASIIQSLRTKQGKNKMWVIVEADEDEKVYGKFITSNCIVKVCAEEEEGNKGHKIVCEVVNAVLDKSNKIIGICDRDYRKYTNIYSDVSNIFYTDYRDLEMMILADDDIKIYLNENTKSQFNESYNKIEDLARYIGYIRIYNDVNRLFIIFHNKLKVGLYWDYTKQCVKEDAKNNILKVFELDEDKLDSFIEQYKLNNEHSCNIIRGHDITKLLKLALVRNEYTKHIDDIYNVYKINHFSKTKLYEDINSFADVSHSESIFQ
jgi:hypothetical protein